MEEGTLRKGRYFCLGDQGASRKRWVLQMIKKKKKNKEGS